MWHTTRKLQEQIRIGKDTVLTVVQMLPGRIQLKLEAPGVEISAPVDRYRKYEFDVDGHNVTLVLTKVVRGVAFVSLDAPRTVKFHNQDAPAVPHE